MGGKTRRWECADRTDLGLTIRRLRELAGSHLKAAQKLMDDMGLRPGSQVFKNAMSETYNLLK